MARVRRLLAPIAAELEAGPQAELHRERQPRHDRDAVTLPDLDPAQRRAGDPDAAHQLRLRQPPAAPARRDARAKVTNDLVRLTVDENLAARAPAPASVAYGHDRHMIIGDAQLPLIRESAADHEGSPGRRPLRAREPGWMFWNRGPAGRPAGRGPDRNDRFSTAYGRNDHLMVTDRIIERLV